MKRLRYDRLMIVLIGFLGLSIFMIYLFSHMSHIYDYQGDIQTLTCTYQQDDKLYLFQLKTFKEKDVRYISLNDMYNVMIVFDKDEGLY